MQTDAPTPTPPAADAFTYARAAIPEPYRILGLRLRPLSLGHYLLLKRFNCAFLAADASQATREDLLLAVLICSMRHQEFLDFIEQKNFSAEVAAWGQEIGVFDFPEKAKLFCAYLAENLHEPEYIPTKPGAEGGDWAQNLKMTLMTRLQHNEESALNLPLSEALADYFKLAENEGLVRIITPEDIAAAEANSRIFAELEKQRAAAPKKEEAPWPA
jgi:hypothetical protein